MARAAVVSSKSDDTNPVMLFWAQCQVKWYWVLWHMCGWFTFTDIWCPSNGDRDELESSFFLEYHHFCWLNFNGFKTCWCHMWRVWGKGNWIKCFGGETWMKETSLKMAWVLKWILKRVGGHYWVHLAKNRNVWQVVVNMILNLQVQ